MGITVSQVRGVVTVTLAGDMYRLDSATELEHLFPVIHTAQTKKVILTAHALRQWDSSLLAVLYGVVAEARRRRTVVDTGALPDGLNRLLELSFAVDRKPVRPQVYRWPFLAGVGDKTLRLWVTVKKGLVFLKQTATSVRRFFSGKAVMRAVDFWNALDACGPKALGIVSLISFMVGLILAFVGAIQLKVFGAQIYVASLVAIGMTRIMGAIMVGIIMAGRTGASYAATIGTMQVNEELDALKTMGIPVSDFLVLPRMLALLIAMPILTILADIMGMIGGASVGVFMLDIAPAEYWKYTVEAFGVTNFLVGVFHGIVFGLVIAACGCYYGVTCGRNADGVGRATTKAVVAAIVWMIVMTGVITWGCEVLNI